MGIIYCYTNKITGKKYIGQTIHPEQRKRNHLHEATVKGSDYYFHRSIRKHGIDAFDYEVLEENIENLNERENYYIDVYDTLWPNGYNQCLAAALDKTAIEKMKETKKRQWQELPENEKQKHRDFLVTLNIGRKHTEETKRKMSESAKKYLKENPRPKRIWTQEMKDRQSKLLKDKYEKGIGRWTKKEGP